MAEPMQPDPILVVHNFYKQPGGEDHSVHSEIALLEKQGHRVVRFVDDNNRIIGSSLVKIGLDCVWNQDAYRSLRDLIRQTRPGVVHFHNTFPLISPSAYYAAKEENVPVVQSFHNFRLLCVNGLLFRNGKRCEECLDRHSPWRGVIHRCYRESVVASAVVASMLRVHQWKRTWQDLIDVYVVSSETAKQKFVSGGISVDQIVIKPNFLEFDPGIGVPVDRYAVFAGRLSGEKGLPTVLDAWRRIPLGFPLRV